MISRLGSLLLVVALLAGAVAATTPRVRAASDGACSGTTGVTVVVDFHQLGGGIVVRCANGTPANGFDALAKAGFDVVQPSNMPGFMCRIDGLPGPDRDACVNTPPANAYWSYWNAAAGGTWKYGQTGPGSRTPAPGTVEGWSWAQDSAGSGAPPPGIDPPYAAAPTATPKATPKPTPRPTPKPIPTATARATATPAPTRTATPHPSASAAAAPAVTPTPTPSMAGTPVASVEDASAPPDPTPAAAAASPLPSTSASSTSVEAPTAAAPSAGDPTSSDMSAASSGTPVGTLLGIALLVLVLVLGFGIRSRRRRN